MKYYFEFSVIRFFQSEKYFKNIYDILYRHQLMNILVNNIPIEDASRIMAIPPLAVSLIGGNYKEKYLKYKEKYLKLKKLLN